MSDTIYNDEEIEILQEKVINDIFNNCLYCNHKNPKVICKTEVYSV